MNVEHNKKTVIEFLDRFSAGDVPGVLGLMSDTATWKVMGREGGLPLSGEMDKDGIARLMNTVKDKLPQGMKLTPTGWTAEGDRVAVEVESFGRKANGTIYQNLYHFLFELTDGQITLIREYKDTLHVKSVFIDG